jgi:hypothetical protein
MDGKICVNPVVGRRFTLNRPKLPPVSAGACFSCQQSYDRCAVCSQGVCQQHGYQGRHGICPPASAASGIEIAKWSRACEAEARRLFTEGFTQTQDETRTVLLGTANALIKGGVSPVPCYYFPRESPRATVGHGWALRGRKPLVLAPSGAVWEWANSGLDDSSGVVVRNAESSELVLGPTFEELVGSCMDLLEKHGLPIPF